MNDFNTRVNEVLSCYKDLFQDFLLNEEIEKLNLQIKNLLFYKVSRFKFPFPMEKMDFLLDTYSFLSENKEKIKTKIENFDQQDDINSYIVKIIKNHFSNLSRSQMVKQIEFSEDDEIEY